MKALTSSAYVLSQQYIFYVKICQHLFALYDWQPLISTKTATAATSKTTATTTTTTSTTILLQPIFRGIGDEVDLEAIKRKKQSRAKNDDVRMYYYIAVAVLQQTVRPQVATVRTTKRYKL
ncbi:hypothetical protein Tsp_06093 [Trichinella spiralis]|uniref:hypothetical protein n=1 Tax=Trichinella spiralis TaxID=6334 RepID=UPI0001EFB448|nr:hypothetical protein Tsp_06093 [Trichinella spiralis]